MKKKQLEQQNFALFAEVERKSNEIAALTLRLNELKESYDEMLSKNHEMNLNLSSLQQEYDALKEHNRQLSEALQDILSSSESQDEVDNDNTATTSKTKSEILSKDTEDISCPVTEEELPESAPIHTKSVSCESNEASEPFTEFKTTHQPEAIAVEKTSPAPLSQTDIDRLRAHGAELIGRLTRQTASLLSQLEQLESTNAEAAKTLLLGKNESFKYRILTLINSKASSEEIKTEMDNLAEETAVYLAASCEGF